MNTSSGGTNGFLARQTRDGDRPFDKVSTGSTRRLRTSGNGFLGKYIVCKLNERGADVFVVQSACYDLRRLEDIRRALNDSAGTGDKDRLRACGWGCRC